ncbi:MAG: DNA polymerase III subunit epsilon [Rhizobiales bacterium]|nr:DNA polymerase III subunit epsilon [Hyphomicrobiales bacterium]MBN9009414.1 DNA polymerase III subunit epsilon [Hyphomicrobiales bacterium]
MREIVFDTETTGLDARGGDRVVEIGCVELYNHIPTGKSFHTFINPERPVSPEAVRVHGLEDAFLKDKPVFRAVAEEFAAFVGDAPMIAHNGMFDLDFINAEFARLGRDPYPVDRIIDTLVMARRKHPGSPVSLDALCSRYQVDLSRRTYHSALLDAELLAEVYVELIGGRQADLLLDEISGGTPILVSAGGIGGERPEAREFRVTGEEMDAHRRRVAALGPNAIWLAYLGEAAPLSGAGA